MFYLQNCDLWNLFKKYQKIELKKKLKDYVSYKKAHDYKPFFHLLHLCTNFQSHMSNNIFLKSIWYP